MKYFDFEEPQTVNNIKYGYGAALCICIAIILLIQRKINGMKFNPNTKVTVEQPGQE